MRLVPSLLCIQFSLWLAPCFDHEILVLYAWFAHVLPVASLLHGLPSSFPSGLLHGQIHAYCFDLLHGLLHGGAPWFFPLFILRFPTCICSILNSMVRDVVSSVDAFIVDSLLCIVSSMVCFIVGSMFCSMVYSMVCSMFRSMVLDLVSSMVCFKVGSLFCSIVCSKILCYVGSLISLLHDRKKLGILPCYFSMILINHM